jgi:tetratricopeptide (TPR) repeat protein
VRIRTALALSAALVLAMPVSARAAASSVAELVREARAHEAAHEDDLAVRRYTEALAIDPTYGEAYLGLGALRLRRGDAREAERVYSVALEHVPSLASALVGRAESRWALGFRDEAERDLEEYARTHEEPAALRLLASWYGEEGHLPAQLSAWRRMRVVAARAGDAALEHEARTMIRALQIVVDRADPAVAPSEESAVRRGISAIARRGG